MTATTTKLQIHWQNRAFPSETIFVEQGEFSDEAAFRTWRNRVIESRKKEMPAGWMPLVCEEGSRFFKPQSEKS